LESKGTREGWLQKVFKAGQDPRRVVVPIIIIIIIVPTKDAKWPNSTVLNIHPSAHYMLVWCEFVAGQVH
jgi:hypothetical protein